MRKTLLQIIRELNLQSFWWKNYPFLWNFFLAIFMGNSSLRLSEVLARFFKYGNKVLTWNLRMTRLYVIFKKPSFGSRRIIIEKRYSKYSKILKTSCLPKRPWQTGKTQIRLLLKKQSDQGIPCLLFWPPFGEF